MTAEQYELLQTRLIEKYGERLDAAVLDELIGEVFSSKTSFVQKNIEGSYPFLLEDTRTIYLHGEAQEDIRVVIKDKKHYIPQTRY